MVIRGRVAPAGVVITVLAAAVPGHAQESAEPLQQVFHMEELRDGIWAARVVDRPEAYAFANSLVVFTDEGVLVVDTQQSPSAAGALITEIRARTDRPVRWVVHTHWHGDHVYGNQAYREAFPDVQFVGHHTMARDLVALTPPRIEAELEEMLSVTQQRQAWLETGIGPSGDALTTEQIDALEYSVRVRRAYVAELQALELIPPDLTFEAEVELHLGGRLIRLLHVGPAHTNGDVVVHLPAESILAVGDLVEAWLPYVEHGDVAGWARALERVRELRAATVVAAHADPENGAVLVEWQADFMAALVTGVDRVRARGGDREAAIAEVTLDGYLERFQAFGVREEAYREWVGATVGLAWDQGDQRPDR